MGKRVLGMEERIIANASALVDEPAEAQGAALITSAPIDDALASVAFRLNDWSVPQGARAPLIRAIVQRFMRVFTDRQFDFDESVVTELAMLTEEVKTLRRRLDALENRDLRRGEV